MDDDLDSLLCLLSEVTNKVEEVPKPSTSKILKEVSIFKPDTLEPSTSNKDNIENEAILDSSDDEEQRNHQSKYNDCGKEIKTLLTCPNNVPERSFSYDRTKKELTWNSKPSESKPTGSTLENAAGYDPVFGIRISNPLVSSLVLKERMVGRTAVPLNQLQYFIQNEGFKEKDWVIGGVIVHKSEVKTSQKGSQYSIWTISDLKDDLKTIGLFLFKNAHTNLWKTLKGTVVAVLNPRIMDRRHDSKDEAILSVDSSERIMILGQGKDLGYCKSLKKTGDKCNAFINTRVCEFCIYHVKQEYHKFSKRTELQSATAGGGLVNLRNKVLGKNEVFYAGRSFTAIKVNNRKLKQKDEGTLHALATGAVRKNLGKTDIVGNKLNAARVECSNRQRAKDLERLKKLGAPIDPLNVQSNIFTGVCSEKISLEQSREHAKNVLANLKAKQESKKGNTESKSEGTEKIEPEKMAVAAPKINKSSYEMAPISLDTEPITNKTVMSKLASIPQSKPKTPISNADKILTETKAPATPKLLNIKPKIESNLPSTSFQKRLQHNNINDIINDPVIKCEKPSQIIQNFKDSIPKTFPTLAKTTNGRIDLTGSPLGNRRLLNRSRLNALSYVAQKGPIQKVDPMNLKGSANKKRLLEQFESPETKRLKTDEPLTVTSARFKEILEAKSLNEHLIEKCDSEAQDQYFNTLEAKEKMEEKMIQTFKIACKAVKCLVCKYTSFSALDSCKADGHALKVFDAMKRFFKCRDCSNRTVTLEVIPLIECGKCGSKNWVKTSMMKEKIVQARDLLSIRGGEEKFIGAVVNDANLNLLVPQ